MKEGRKGGKEGRKRVIGRKDRKEKFIKEGREGRMNL